MVDAVVRNYTDPSPTYTLASFYKMRKSLSLSHPGDDDDDTARLRIGFSTHTHTEKEVKKKKKDISTPDSVESLFSPFLGSAQLPIRPDR